MPQSPYLTLKQAATFTGKSHSTLRRFIKPIISNPSSPDRHFLRPDCEEEKRLKKNKQPFQWEIHDDLLTREFRSDGTRQTEAAKDTSPPVGAGEWSTLLSMLQQQLQEKDEQLRRKDEHIAQLTERLKEGNILQQTTLQAVPPGTKVDDAVTVPSAGVGDSSTEKPGAGEGSEPSKEPRSKARRNGEKSASLPKKK